MKKYREVTEFDAIAFCEDYNIDYWLEGKNTSPGWVSMQCPFCGDHSNHGAINPSAAYYYCWRCGWHGLPKVLKELTGLRNPYPILEKYGVLLSDVTRKKVHTEQTFRLPGNKLEKVHKDYLLHRRFDPDYIEQKYSIRGTIMDKQFSNRIITPVFYDGEVVSFLGRDYTGRQELRHKDCPVGMAKIHHKELLYGMEYADKDRVVVVEGAYDKWRLGDGAVATLGTSWTMTQLTMLAERYETVFIFFDKGYESQNKAKNLAIGLSSLGIDTDVISTEYEEPDDLPEKDVVYLKKELGL